MVYIHQQHKSDPFIHCVYAVKKLQRKKKPEIDIILIYMVGSINQSQNDNLRNYNFSVCLKKKKQQKVWFKNRRAKCRQIQKQHQQQNQSNTGGGSSTSSPSSTTNLNTGLRQNNSSTLSESAATNSTLGLSGKLRTIPSSKLKVKPPTPILSNNTR